MRIFSRISWNHRQRDLCLRYNFCPSVISWFACDGLLAGDVIIAVDRTNLSKTAPDAFSKVVDIVKRNPKSDVLFRIERWNQDFDIRVHRIRTLM